MPSLYRSSEPLVTLSFLKFCLPVLYSRSLTSDLSHSLRSNLPIIFPLFAIVFYFLFRHSQLCILVLKFSPIQLILNSIVE